MSFSTSIFNFTISTPRQPFLSTFQITFYHLIFHIRIPAHHCTKILDVIMLSLFSSKFSPFNGLKRQNRTEALVFSADGPFNICRFECQPFISGEIHHRCAEVFRSQIFPRWPQESLENFLCPSLFGIHFFVH